MLCTWWRHQMKHLTRYGSLMRGIHQSPVNSPHKCQWRRALGFSLICARTNGWVNNRDAGDLRRHLAHYDVTVMQSRTSKLILQMPVFHFFVPLDARPSAATMLIEKLHMFSSKFLRLLVIPYCFEEINDVIQNGKRAKSRDTSCVSNWWICRHFLTEIIWFFLENFRSILPIWVLSLLRALGARIRQRNGSSLVQVKPLSEPMILLSIGLSGTNFGEIWTDEPQVKNFHSRNAFEFKASSAKCWPLYPGVNMCWKNDKIALYAKSHPVYKWWSSEIAVGKLVPAPMRLKPLFYRGRGNSLYNVVHAESKDMLWSVTIRNRRRYS